MGTIPTPPATDEPSARLAVPFGAGIAYALGAAEVRPGGRESSARSRWAARTISRSRPSAALKVYLAKNSFLSLGGGVGFIPGNGANPDLRAFLGIVFEPNIGDRDGDGLKDDVDQCPDDPEDFDDFEDEDGCPEPDNDRDGILDVDDQCPNEPEDKDGFEDEDGCPEGNELDRDGDGIPDNVDQCPDDPEDKDGFQDEDGCPDLDNDQDGILDVDDLCPDDPEDIDGFEDKDGCPDPDNDNDRILDKDDECPRIDGETREETAETYNGDDDDDGCPDRGRVVVTDTKIEILDKIYFEYNKAVIKSESYPILDAIVATLEGNPDIHSSRFRATPTSAARDAYNLDLSDGAPPRCAPTSRSTASTPAACSRTATARRSPSRPIERGGLGQEPARRVPHPQAHRRLSQRQVERSRREQSRRLFYCPLPVVVFAGRVSATCRRHRRACVGYLSSSSSPGVCTRSSSEAVASRRSMLRSIWLSIRRTMLSN